MSTKQQPVFFGPLLWAFRSLAEIAFGTQKLKVIGIIRTTLDYWLHVINVVLSIPSFCNPVFASGAKTSLEKEERGYIGSSMFSFCALPSGFSISMVLLNEVLVFLVPIQKQYPYVLFVFLSVAASLDSNPIFIFLAPHFYSGFFFYSVFQAFVWITLAPFTLPFIGPLPDLGAMPLSVEAVGLLSVFFGPFPVSHNLCGFLWAVRHMCAEFHGSHPILTPWASGDDFRASHFRGFHDYIMTESQPRGKSFYVAS